MVEFEDGLVATISPVGNCDVRLTCANGVVSVESDGHLLTSRFSTDGDPYWRRTEVLGSGDTPGGTCFAIRRLIGSSGVNAEADSREDKYGILAGQRLLFACLQSHLEGGRAVAMADIDPSLSINGRSGDRFA
jgi:hypothetical protein